MFQKLSKGLLTYWLVTKNCLNKPKIKAMKVVSIHHKKDKQMPKKIDLFFNREFAKEREGESRLPNGNHKLYTCPAGYMTIGWGYNIEEHGIDDADAERFLNHGLNIAQSEASKLVSNWHDLVPARKSVLVDMAFNMGITTLSKFKNMIAAIEKGDWRKAAAEMKDSSWYKQVGSRSKVLHKMMLEGKYPK